MCHGGKSFSLGDHAWLALNVNTDLSYFNYIVPCGIADKAVASLEGELGHQVSLQEVRERITQHFLEVFSATLA